MEVFLHILLYTKNQSKTVLIQYRTVLLYVSKGNKNNSVLNAEVKLEEFCSGHSLPAFTDRQVATCVLTVR